jgi:hypothetical protein
MSLELVPTKIGFEPPMCTCGRQMQMDLNHYGTRRALCWYCLKSADLVPVLVPESPPLILLGVRR